MRDELLEEESHCNGLCYRRVYIEAGLSFDAAEWRWEKSERQEEENKSLRQAHEIEFTRSARPGRDRAAQRGSRDISRRAR